MKTVSESYSQAAINQSLTKKQKIHFLLEMYRIRNFERLALKNYNEGKIGGFLHLYVGQESVAVGMVSLMGKNDHLITAYRDHGHALAVGMSMESCMAELYGKATGCSQGKGGSMHFFAPDQNYWGGHGIVGGQTPLGLGIAFSLKYRGQKGCCFACLGDGAVNQGVYHESLNLAALWNLPVIYVIENNYYSMGTSLARSSAVPRCLAERAEGYGIAWDVVNGSDLYEIRAKLQVAMERAHEASLPTVIEIQTYRFYGHSVADSKHKGGYRTAEEIEEYKQQHDPVILWENTLIEEDLLSREEAVQLDRQARQEAVKATVFAEESPFPQPEDIFHSIYYEVDHQTSAGQTGRHFFNGL